MNNEKTKGKNRVGLTQEEVAEVMHINVRTVRRIEARALHKLTMYLEARGHGNK